MHPLLWNNLSQEEKFNIMRDYVRRGFHNLDDIMNDYNSSVAQEYEKPSSDKPDINSAFLDVMDEYYD